MKKGNTMQHVSILFAVLVLCGFVGTAGAVQLKELDSDVNYDESKVPHYDLPRLLVTAEGVPVETPER